MGNKNWRRPIQSSDGNNRILCVNGWRIMWSILPWFLGVAQLAEGASKNRKLNSDSNSGMSWQVALAIFGSVFGVVLVVLCCVVLYAVYVTRQDEKDEHRAQTQAAIAASNESSAMTMENADSVLRRMQQGVILKLPNEDPVADFGIDDPIPVTICPICMVMFEQGIRVVTSTCHHVFHRDCMRARLVIHLDCPCCGQSFVDPASLVTTPPH